MSLGRRGRFAPSLLGQVLALVLLSVLAAQVINVGIVFLVPPPAPEFYRVSEIAAVLRAEGRPLRAHNGHLLKAQLLPQPRTPEAPLPSRVQVFLGRSLAGQLSTAPDRVRLALLGTGPGFTAHRNYRLMREQLMGDRRRPGGQKGDLGLDRSTPGGDHFVIVPFEAAYQLPDGRWSVLRVLEGGLLSEWQKRVLLGFTLAVLLMCPLAYVFARRLSAPIVAFARAAERLGRDPGATPLDLRGPKEISTAVSAFNEMQGRLKRYVADRTELIGAIAHDLRTPLTRLRFRIEDAPIAQRAKIESDLDQMEAMISATLAFVRDATQIADRRPVDLHALVGAVTAEMSETGLDVRLAAGQPVIVDGDPMALRRLITNLLDNAVKFGRVARARVTNEEGSVLLDVQDDGPGIPEHEQERVFEPFHRGERSRSRETGGTGLGLAVVRSIARAHGGDVALGNRPEGGLEVQLRLPRLAS